MNISGIVMTAAAPNRDNALALMEFLASDTAQELYAETNHEYPVKPRRRAAPRSSPPGASSRRTSCPWPRSRSTAGEATRLVDTVDYDG